MKYLHSVTRNTSFKKITLPLLAILAIVISYMGSHAYATHSIKRATVCRDTCIALLSTGFSKTEISIKVGDFIQFNAADGKRHDLALGEGLVHTHNETAHSTQAVATDTHEKSGATVHDHVANSDSGEFGNGEAWRVQIKHAGTYMVHDHLHPENNILVVAYSPSSTQ